MNEREVEHTLAAYANSLGKCQRVPKPSRRTRTMKWSAVAVAGAILVGVALWPRNAAAGAFKDIQRSITDAKTMELKCWFEYYPNSGNWRMFLDNFYKDGLWRSEVRKTERMAVSIVLRKDKVLTEYTHLDHAALDQWRPSPFGQEPGPETALEYVLRTLNTGNVDEERSFSIRPHDPVNGKEAYLLHIERPVDGYLADLIVEKNSNLPISATTQLGLGPTKLKYRFECTFNQPLPDSMFELASAKPIINVGQAKQGYADDWKKPIAVAGDTQVLDARSTADGSIWILTRQTSDALAVPLPERLREGKLEFARMFDGMGHLATFDQGSSDTVLSVFTPLEGDKDLRPDRVTLQFGQRPPDFSPLPKDQKLGTSQTWTLTIPVKPEPNSAPDYLCALGLDRFELTFQIEKIKARALEYERRGEFAKAGGMYEALSPVQAYWLNRGASGFGLRDAARCYREAGRVAKANDLAAKAEILIRRY
jgi:hypothetical protein